jgi:hypothetical protein
MRGPRRKTNSDEAGDAIGEPTGQQICILVNETASETCSAVFVTDAPHAS